MLTFFDIERLSIKICFLVPKDWLFVHSELKLGVLKIVGGGYADTDGVDDSVAMGVAV